MDQQIDLLPRIVCIGSNKESEVALYGLLEQKVNVIGLVTLPSNHNQEVSDYVDLHDLCYANNLTVVDTTDVNSSETCHAIRNLHPDYIFTLGWSQLFKEELLSIPKRYVVGSHPSPLPEGCGRAPVPWTILQGRELSAVTLFKMDLSVDSGPILLQKFFTIPTGATALHLYQLVANNLRDGFCELYQQILQGTTTETAHDSAKTSCRAKRVPADGHIDFSQSAEKIELLIRASSQPYPGAYTYYHGDKVTVWKASLTNPPDYTGTTGQIVLRKKEQLLVQTGDGCIWLEDFEIDGRKIEPQQFKVGDKFGFNLEDEIYQLKKELQDLQQRMKMYDKN